MAITNAQQYQQLVNKPADGKRPGYRGPGGYQGGRSSRSSGPAGGASSGGNYGGNRNTGGGGGGNRNTGGGNQNTGNAREDYITNYVSKSKVKGGGKRIGPKGQGFGYEDRDFSDKTDPTNKKIIDRQRTRYQDQFTSKGFVPPGPNRESRQRALNYLNRNMSRYLDRFGSYYDPNRFGITKTGYPNFGLPNIYDIIDEELDARGDIRDILKTGNMIPIGKSGKSFEMSAVPDLDIDSIRELASTQTTLQGAPLTGYQANALESLRETINKRDNFLETGDTSDIFPDPPEPRPDDGPEEMDPCKGPNPPAYCFVNQDTTPEDPRQILSTRILGSQFDPTFFAADGGIANLARQELFLGGIVKGVKKGLKGITRGIKKVAKSPLGKIALAAAAGGYGFGLGPFKGLAGSGFLKGAGMKNFFLKDAAKGFGLGNLSGKGIASIIGGASLLPLLMGQKEDEFDIEEYYRQNALNPNAPLNRRIAGSEFSFADGGSTEKEPVAKKTMPLLDMGGQEMDLRAKGGFVPIGRMEKADDVPARLSKNEFVFTAEAVRNAGDGDVDKGAEVMYNMMKNLEDGGNVSEESQGLEGARNMFQTSQRLGEVL